MIKVSELSFQGSEFQNHISYIIGDVSFSKSYHMLVLVVLLFVQHIESRQSRLEGFLQMHSYTKQTLTSARQNKKIPNNLRHVFMCVF